LVLIHFHRIQIGSKIAYKTCELQINIRHFKAVLDEAISLKPFSLGENKIRLRCGASIFLKAYF
jgi:hypothetical protein